MCLFYVPIFMLSSVTSTDADPRRLSNNPTHTADELPHEVGLYRQASQSQMDMCSPCLGILSGIMGSGDSLDDIKYSIKQVWKNLQDLV